MSRCCVPRQRYRFCKQNDSPPLLCKGRGAERLKEYARWYFRAIFSDFDGILHL